MGLEKSDSNPIIQFSRVEQFLTPDGMNTNQVTYTVGNIVSERRGSFFGKQTLVSEIREQLNTTGIAVIEGGHRSGKTSLLITTGERMVENKDVQTSVYCNLQTLYSKTPEEIVNVIEEKIVDSSPKRKKGAVTAVISFDEIEAYLPANQEKLLDAVNQMKLQGHKILISVIGDLHSGSPSELPRQTKNKILEMTDDKTLLNRLLSDEEMKQLLEHGKSPVFTESMTTYLIAEAGGHPLMAGLLAVISFQLLRHKEVEPNKVLGELAVRCKGGLGSFDEVVDKILAAGFDPRTWEWHGIGDQPNVEVYQNMIPRPTSTIFKKWLEAYLYRQGKGPIPEVF